MKNCKLRPWAALIWEWSCDKGTSACNLIWNGVTRSCMRADFELFALNWHCRAECWPFISRHTCRQNQELHFLGRHIVWFSFCSQTKAVCGWKFIFSIFRPVLNICGTTYFCHFQSKTQCRSPLYRWFWSWPACRWRTLNFDIIFLWFMAKHKRAWRGVPKEMVRSNNPEILEL